MILLYSFGLTPPPRAFTNKKVVDAQWSHSLCVTNSFKFITCLHTSHTLNLLQGFYILHIATLFLPLHKIDQIIPFPNPMQPHITTNISFISSLTNFNFFFIHSSYLIPQFSRNFFWLGSFDLLSKLLVHSSNRSLSQQIGKRNLECNC